MAKRLRNIKEVNPGVLIGNLVLLERISSQKWLCRCTCGAMVVKSRTYIESTESPTCGARLHRRVRGVRDLTGKVFGRLTALRHVDYDRYGNAMWECKCECGKTCVTRTNSLVRGRSQSCGCLRREFAARNLPVLHAEIRDTTDGL